MKQVLGEKGRWECRRLAVEGHYYSMVEISIPAAVTGPKRSMGCNCTGTIVPREGKKEGNICRVCVVEVYDFGAVEVHTVPLWVSNLITVSHSKLCLSSVPNSPFWRDGGKIKIKNTFEGV